MSNAVFPVLPGLMWDVERTPIWSTRVQASTGGQELREAFWSAPIYRYTLAYELLRQGSATPELATLARFFEDRQGAYDSFLYTDPSDSTVSGMGFGVGDGATTAFQLQRSLGGQVSDALGTTGKPTIPTWNALLWSNDLSNAAWTKTTGVTATANAAVAPDGTPTASRVAYDGSGAAGGVRVSQSAGASARGVPYLGSLWLRADAPLTLRLDLNVGPVTVALTTAWQRFTTATLPGDAFAALLMALSSPAATNTPFVLSAWGGQVENVAAGQTTPGPVIPTTSAAGRGAPALYPAAGDGFEPVTNPNAVTLARLGDWQGAVPLSPASRTNLLLRSQAMATSAWTLQVGCTLTNNAAIAPDGTTTATFVKNNTPAAGASVYQTATLAKGGTYTLHTWILGDATNTIADVGLFDSVAGAWLQGTAVILHGAVTTVGVVTPGLFRVTINQNTWTHVAVTATVGVNASILAFLYPNGQATVLGTGCYAWGWQLEAGAVAGDYIVTAAAAASRTDYTLGAGTGVVTLTVAPAANATLLWSGSFFWRCRFEDDTTTFTNFLYQLWANKRLSFRTVK